jgi:hypothetical protein
VNDSDLGQLIAGAVLALTVAGLYGIKRDDYVATVDFTVPDPPQPPPAVARTFAQGSVVPAGIGEGLVGVKTRKQRRSWLAGILVGKDNRTSTSKTMAFLWTLAVAWGLLSLMLAAWFGTRTGWAAQTGRGLQEEYLLLLGGPYAAAVLAKTVTAARSETKTEAEPGSADVQQLVTDDKGDAELGDFQYVLFGLVTLAYFVGDFVGDAERAFPELPPLLTGLALTSVAGYSAKKLLAESAPKMTSVIPPKAAALGELQIFGVDLTVPAGVSESGAAVLPIVTVGGARADVTAHEKVLGSDRLTVNVPAGATAGSAPIAVTRGDGVPAKTPSGEHVLAFEVG